MYKPNEATKQLRKIINLLKGAANNPRPKNAKIIDPITGERMSRTKFRNLNVAGGSTIYDPKKPGNQTSISTAIYNKNDGIAKLITIDEIDPDEMKEIITRYNFNGNHYSVSPTKMEKFDHFITADNNGDLIWNLAKLRSYQDMQKKKMRTEIVINKHNIDRAIKVIGFYLDQKMMHEHPQYMKDKNK